MARAPVVGSGRCPACTANVLKPNRRSSSAVTAPLSATCPFGSGIARYSVVVSCGYVSRQLSALPQCGAHDTVLLRSCHETLQSVFRSVGIEANRGPNALKSDRSLLVDPHRASKIEIAIDLNLHLAQLDVHRRGDHPQRDLLTCGERSQEEVARAGQFTVTSGHGMSARVPTRCVGSHGIERGNRTASRVIAG